MKIVDKLKRFYHDYLKCPDSEKFDADFRFILQVFYFFGFYQPTPSKTRAAYGVLMFSLVVLTLTLGALRDTFLAWSLGNWGETVINATIFVYTFPMMAQIVLVARNTQICEVIKELQNLHEYDDDDNVKVYRKKCLKMMKVYQIVLATGQLIVTCLKFFGLPFNLILPVLYDELAQGHFFYFFLAINIIHHTCLWLVLHSCDLLHILCMVRIEANLKLLTNQIRRCTDDDDLRVNEKELIACIRYHITIIEKTRKLQKVFKVFFAVMLYGIFLEQSLLVLALLKIQGDLVYSVLVFACIIVSLFKLLTICFFGQRVTTNSEDLMDATYFCKWYTQTTRFKKMLITLRHVSNVDLKICAGEYDLTHETFYQAIRVIYDLFNNFSSLMGNQLDASSNRKNFSRH